MSFVMAVVIMLHGVRRLRSHAISMTITGQFNVTVLIFPHADCQHMTHLYYYFFITQSASGVTEPS